MPPRRDLVEELVVAEVLEPMAARERRPGGGGDVVPIDVGPVECQLDRTRGSARGLRRGERGLLRPPVGLQEASGLLVGLEQRLDTAAERRVVAAGPLKVIGAPPDRFVLRRRERSIVRP